MTIPLLTTSNGEKFGKSAGNAVWLDEGRTGISDFYQVSPMRPSGRLLLLRDGHRSTYGYWLREARAQLIFERLEPDEERADTQFFIRSTDEDVGKYLRLFTLLPLERIDEIMAEHQVRRFSLLNLSNHPHLFPRHPNCRSVTSHTKELKMRDRS
jgi:tyrosyl-tRNA synthetase